VALPQLRWLRTPLHCVGCAHGYERIGETNGRESSSLTALCTVHHLQHSDRLFTKVKPQTAQGLHHCEAPRLRHDCRLRFSHHVLYNGSAASRLRLAPPHQPSLCRHPQRFEHVCLPRITAGAGKKGQGVTLFCGRKICCTVISLIL
jgi:hypothetical protein